MFLFFTDCIFVWSIKFFRAEHLFQNIKISSRELNSPRFHLTYFVFSNNCSQKSNLSPSQKSALLELYFASNLIIAIADNGGQTVLKKLNYVPHVETMPNSGP